MPEEPPEPSTEIKQDKLLTYAHEIIMGKGGGEYIYSLQEDYVYSYEDGVWKQLFDKEFLARLEKSMPEITRYSLPVRKMIIENFKWQKFIRIEKFNNHPLINFENYMVDPLGLNVLAHKKEYYSTNRIPYKYDALAQCPLWEKTLDEILEKDTQKKNSFQEFIGYCLIPEINQKKALLLLGESDSGKSTLLFTIKNLIGIHNYASVPLQYLPNPQYTPLLINKMVNIDADVNKNAGDYEREFKIITSGETVSCNQKHIPTFEFIPKCKIILAANIFPKITDHSSAFYKRLILIPCDRVFEEAEQNKNLVNDLIPELPGIFNWAVEGLQRLNKRGRFEKYEFMKEAVEELENENNPSYLFFEEHILIEFGAEIEKGELYEKYKQWSEKNTNYKLSAGRFATAVYKKFKTQTPKDTKNLSTLKRIWRNIRYVDNKSSEPIKTEINFQDNKPLDKTASPSTIAAQGENIDWSKPIWEN